MKWRCKELSLTISHDTVKASRQRSGFPAWSPHADWRWHPACHEPFSSSAPSHVSIRSFDNGDQLCESTSHLPINDSVAIAQPEMADSEPLIAARENLENVSESQYDSLLGQERAEQSDEELVADNKRKQLLAYLRTRDFWIVLLLGYVIVLQACYEST